MPMSVLGPRGARTVKPATTVDQSIWKKLSRRWKRNPGNISLDSLPVELIHSICSLLKPKDVQNFRLACRVFGAVGAEYLLDEIHTICKRSAFNRMVAISDNVVSKHVRSLYYEADLLEPRDDFWDWNAHRSHLPDGFHSTHHPPAFLDEKGQMTERSKRALERHWKKAMEEGRRREMRITREQLTTAFSKYQDYYDDQERMFEDGFDVDCFEKCFRNCPKITDIYVSLANEIRLKTKTDRREFKDALASTFGDLIATSGVRQLTGILRATQRVGIKLEGLYAGDVSFRFFTQSEETMEEIKDALKSLTTLEFHVLTPYYEHNDDLYDDDDPVDPYELEEVIANSEAGCFRDVLACVPQLRTLHLTLPEPFGMGERVALSSLFSSDQTFKYLESLRLFSVATTEQELSEFILRHKDTLRSVFFTDLEFDDGRWNDFFRGISRQLPHLRRFRLSGEFISDEDEWWFGEIDMARSTRLAWAMDRYIRNGGPLPIDRNCIVFHVPHPMNHGKPGVGEDGRIDDPESDCDESESEGISDEVMKRVTSTIDLFHHQVAVHREYL